MKRKNWLILGLTAALSFGSAFSSLAAETITMENCGAYLFEWRPVDCGDGRAFAILVGGNTLTESNVILNRGYDYAYTFNPMAYPRPWGTVPDLVNIDGVWGIPENWASLPEGSQPTMRITLYTNYKNLSTPERYVDVVHLPNGVNTAELPPEVRKYLINVDGSDAGAYDGTETAGWFNENGHKKYRKPDGTCVVNSWLKIDGESYYMDENGYMLKDTITPDGIYVNSNGERCGYMPGWLEIDGVLRYVQKNGYYAQATWVKDTDGKYYYFDMAANMVTDRITPDGYYVGPDGVWDGQPTTLVTDPINLGPGANAASSNWEFVDDNWKYKQDDGTYLTNGWAQDLEGKWYYLDDEGLMMADQVTPDGYYVDESGVWNGAAPAVEEEAEEAAGDETENEDTSDEEIADTEAAE
ncbi:MAG: N-acetylmuramoyl-L-alanine amidase family protein [Lachnospiraceae bacterium]